MSQPAQITWQDAGTTHSALWLSDSGMRPPAKVMRVDDTLTADAAYRLACEGTGLLWSGDFQNARQLLQALKRRLDRPPRKGQVKKKEGKTLHPAPSLFNAHRQAQAQRARVLGQILILLEPDYTIALRRAPAMQLACQQAWGPADGQARVVSLRQLQGVIGAFEWRKNGVDVPAMGAGLRIYPHYGVFSPVRGEYVELVAKAPWPAAMGKHPVAFDIGAGTGVLSAVLARRGAARVMATDVSERALACARDNLQRLGLQNQVELMQTDLFPPGQAAVVVCNPPWLPARATSLLEQAVYDEGSQMLRGFLASLAQHLCPGGEGWLILSDLAEHLDLRSREELLGWISQAGLVVLDRLDTRPSHGKAMDTQDPLHTARAKEVTSLWRLGVVPD